MHPRGAHQVDLRPVIHEAQEDDLIPHALLLRQPLELRAGVARAGNQKDDPQPLPREPGDRAHQQIDALVALEASQVEQRRSGRPVPFRVGHVVRGVDPDRDDLGGRAQPTRDEVLACAPRDRDRRPPVIRQRQRPFHEPCGPAGGGR